MTDIEPFKFPDEQNVEVVDDTPPEDRNRKPMNEPPKEVTDDELAKYDEGVKKRIQHFSKGYHEERRQKEAALREREEALRLAQAVVEENKQLRGSLSQGHTALLEQAKRVVETELEAAKRKFKAAADSFDSEAMLAAQEELTAAKIKADKIANFKPEPLQQSETAVKIQQVATQPRAQPVDDKLSEWQGRNRWFGVDKRMTAYALGLHEELVEKGVRPGTEQYYAELDKDLSKRFPDVIAPAKSDAEPRTQGQVVAPATRSTAPKKIVLTKTQVQIAKRLGVPLDLYARKVAEEMRKQNG